MKSADISILYLGVTDGTSLDRANALRRVGYRVQHVSLLELLPSKKWAWRITWKLGGQWLSPWLLARLPAVLKDVHFDLCLVDSGEFVTPSIIRLLRRHARKIVNYNLDDPFGKRDATRFVAYRQSIPYYDLCAVVRQENVAEAETLGARQVVRVFRSADELSHSARPLTDTERREWHSEVMFLGTWFPERGPFLLSLANRGVPLTIRGANWHKAPEWSSLQSYWKGGPLQGDDYARAIQCARVNLGLLSLGNRDLHTTRSLEIPAIGGLLCAERTTEHQELYVEGEEALFWSGLEECAAVCLDVLGDEPRRLRIAAAGHARVVSHGYYNQNVMKSLVDRALAA